MEIWILRITILFSRLTNTRASPRSWRRLTLTLRRCWKWEEGSVTIILITIQTTLPITQNAQCPIWAAKATQNRDLILKILRIKRMLRVFRKCQKCRRFWKSKISINIKICSSARPRNECSSPKKIFTSRTSAIWGSGMGTWWSRSIRRQAGTCATRLRSPRRSGLYLPAMCNQSGNIYKLTFTLFIYFDIFIFNCLSMFRI